MEVILGLLEWLQPYSIYGKLGDVVKIYVIYMVPTALAFGLACRYAELVAENLGQGAQWTDAVKGVFLASVFTGVYISFGVVVIKFHNAFAMLMYEHGSIGTILGSYQELLQAAKELTKDRSLFSNVVGWTNFLTQKSINWLFFYFTFIALVLVQILLRIIYALAFCILYLWGMAAVPSMSSKLFNLANGWVRSVIALALWPFVEATLFMFVDALFKGWGQALLPNNAYQAELGMSGLYLLFSFCNLILIGVLLAALVMSIMIASSQNMLTGLAAPVLASGVAGLNLWKNLTLKTASAVNPMSQPTFGALGGKGMNALKRFNERSLPGLWNFFKQHAGQGAGTGGGSPGGSSGDGVLSNLDITSKGNGSGSSGATQTPDTKGPGMR